MKPIEPAGLIGADVPRVDGVLKVTGAAKYGADHKVDRPAWAYLVTSTIANGRVAAIDDAATRAIPGVIDVLTHQNVGNAIRPGKALLAGGFMASGTAPLHDDAVHFSGQIVAVVVAESFEIARAGARALAVAYAAERPTASFDSPGAEQVKPKSISETELSVGDFEAAYAAAAVTVDQHYETPPQHHNPLELFQTTCSWDGPKLTVFESSQHVTGYQRGLAEQLGIKPEDIRVRSPFVGGAFGSRGELAQSTALIAFAARRLNRPVKLVATRTDGFTLRTFRAETRHHVRLGATADGRLTAVSHEGWELTAKTDHFALAGIESSCRLYACANIEGKVHNVTADRQPPGFMRAPPEVPYLFAMESAIDELAEKLNVDPIELRKRNETQHEPIKGLPFTSRSLVQCYDAAATAFGWADRDPRAGSMRDGDWLVGYGCATAMYPATIAAADCRVTLAVDGRATVETGAHDIGTGLYTVATQTAADGLGLPIDRVTVRLGDTNLPAAPLTAGSSGTASICSVIAKACNELCGVLAAAAVKAGPLAGLGTDGVRLRDGRLVATTGESEPLSAAVARVNNGAAVVDRDQLQPERLAAADRPDVDPPRAAGADQRRQAQGRRAVLVRGAIGRGAGRPPHGRGPRAALGRGLRRRSDHEPPHGPQPAVRRAGVGHGLGPARGDRDRPRSGPVHEQRLGRVPPGHVRRRAVDHDDHGARGGQPGEPDRGQGRRRAGRGRAERRHRQRGVPRDRRAVPHAADPRRSPPAERPAHVGRLTAHRPQEIDATAALSTAVAAGLAVGSASTDTT